MRALLLAAGFGTRLKPLTDSIPKPLIPVNGLPMIAYNLALLKHHGIREVVINLHHLGNKIRKTLGQGKNLGMKIHYSNEPQILGTGGGIRKAARFFDEDILIINSDIISDIDLSTLIKSHRRHKNLATLVLRRHADAKTYGLLHYQRTKLTSILGKPRAPVSSLAAHFTGIHIVKKAAVLRLPQNRASCIIQDLYIPALVAGERFGAQLHRGIWTDCGTHQALAEATQKLQSDRHRLKQTPELAQFYKILTS
jgi:NDP-sugar pyrophosphorylase family protein